MPCESIDADHDEAISYEGTSGRLLDPVSKSVARHRGQSTRSIALDKLQGPLRRERQQVAFGIVGSPSAVAPRFVIDTDEGNRSDLHRTNQAGGVTSLESGQAVQIHCAVGVAVV